MAVTSRVDSVAFVHHIYSEGTVIYFHSLSILNSAQLFFRFSLNFTLFEAPPLSCNPSRLALRFEVGIDTPLISSVVFVVRRAAVQPLIH